MNYDKRITKVNWSKKIYTTFDFNENATIAQFKIYKHRSPRALNC